jgi:arsenite-transporting ATPase
LAGEEIESYIQAASAEPAMESPPFDAVVAGEYDYYIYDLVPLGHALYYLSMATVYDAWIDKITSLREQMREYDQVAAQLKRDQTLDEDAILNELLYIKERIQTSSRILTDRERTAFFFVLVPEEMIILDTAKAAELFSRFKVPISGYVVNRVLPRNYGTKIPDCARIEQQGVSYQNQETFGNQVLTQVPELERDITGLPMISRLAEYLFR